ncbi:polysaccharide lyase family 7 protein [Agarivorans sp. QJM3NY_33]|uniref:polysaccharide lyase family 7 protein n=1 Tax=Agarivorans sp. QJM3NY_33 TaxID=3421432 RepID=UPI003D7C8079
MKIVSVFNITLLLMFWVSNAQAVTDLQRWMLSIPVDETHNGRADNIKERELVAGFAYSPYFEVTADRLVFRSPVQGPKTSSNTSYTRSELREMLRAGDKQIKSQGVTRNNWVFSSAPEQDQRLAGAVDGVMEAELAVNHVTTTGDKRQVGRVVIGQIHANHDEPIRLYYRKLPQHQKGSIYFAHDRIGRKNQWIEMIGSKSSSAPEPENGIALNERFTYRIAVSGNLLTVTLKKAGDEDIVQQLDMSHSGYDQGGQYMYFKAGVYNQNKSGEPDDYVQATFYRIDVSH